MITKMITFSKNAKSKRQLFPYYNLCSIKNENVFSKMRKKLATFLRLLKFKQLILDPRKNIKAIFCYHYIRKSNT